MTKQTCRWLHKLATWDPATATGTPAEYCGKPVGYTNPIHPDSGNRERKWNDFCDEHMVAAAAQPDEDGSLL